MAIASTKSLSGWTKTFTGPRLRAAIVDRLTFGGNMIETGTASYRLAYTPRPTHQLTPTPEDNGRRALVLRVAAPRAPLMLAALRHRGVQAALLAAVLFGAGTPAAKLLLGGVSPWLLAGLLYCGSGLGLGLIRLARRAPRVHLTRAELAPLAGAIAFGGIAGPVLMMIGLTRLPGSGRRCC